MQITVGECLKIAKDCEREIYRLMRQRAEEAFVYHDKDEEPPCPQTGVFNLTEKITELSIKARLLRKKVAEKNLDTFLDCSIEGQKITLAEGITLLGQLLRERDEIQSFVGVSPQKKERSGLAGQYQYKTITYDLESMEDYARRTDENIRKLRTAIDKANVTTNVQFTPEEQAIL